MQSIDSPREMRDSVENEGAGMIGLLMLASLAQGPVYYTGDTLYDICQSDVLIKQARCAFYVAAISDLNSDSVGVGIIDPPLFCIPEGVPLGTTKDIVVAYLREHPAARKQGAAGLTVVALAQAYPCPKS